jgi:putative FmdB family regulatory protein
MPQYEFVCKDCNKSFSTFLTLKEYEISETACPTCGSKKVEQQLSSAYVVTSKKSAA